jgi:hypothetical protein
MRLKIRVSSAAIKVAGEAHEQVGATAAETAAAEGTPSGQKPEMNLAPRDLVDLMAQELANYHAWFHDLFKRREQRDRRIGHGEFT